MSPERIWARWVGGQLTSVVCGQGGAGSVPGGRWLDGAGEELGDVDDLQRLLRFAGALLRGDRVASLCGALCGAATRISR
jgi:hypothetical protein